MQVRSPLSHEQSNVAGGQNSPLVSNAFASFAFIGIILATFLCYSPVLFNFFNGDDFVHLTWLVQAIHHPELVWRNFYTSWLDGTTTKFYRPLISVFMVSDYALYGVNGLGFRITNLIFHLSSTLLIYLIGKKINAAVPEQSKNAGALSSIQEPANIRDSRFKHLFWPVSAAALFALYPLHPEAVSWITGRVDSVVTAFCLGAVYFYICFSNDGKIRNLILSLASATLGLLSKEMAITLPAVFVLYETVYFQSAAGKNLFSISAVIDLALRCLRKTICFWILLGAYFVVRYFALGTFVGGYDNSLLFIANMNEFLAGWKHALLMFLVPINKSLIGSHHILSKLWPAALLGSVGCVLVNFAVDKNNRRHMLFLLAWLALCLAPVYKLFAISDDLQGSRLAYLATVPLCMLLTTGLLNNAKLQHNRLWNYLSSASVILLLVLSGIVLYINNQPWRQAGEANNAIRASLQSLYKNLDGDPQILFLGLPDQINGAYTCRNSLDGMTRKPQLDRDAHNCLMVNAFEPIFPFGYLKESITENKDKLYVYRWSTEKGNFDKVELPGGRADASSGAAPLDWKLEQLQRICCIPEQKSAPQLSFSSSGQMQLSAGASRRGNTPQFVELNLGARSCFDTDFIEMDVELPAAATGSSGADLLYSNDMYPSFELKRRVHAQFVPGAKTQRLLFALRGLPEWSFGGKTHAFRLLLPANTDMSVNSVSIVPAGTVMPSLNFENSGYFGTKGYYHLQRNSTDKKPISIDASKITGAENCCVEITRANLLFEEQNPQHYSNVAMLHQHLKGNRHQYALDPSLFTSPGIYELRVFPLAQDDATVCGAASDHIVISVDP